MKDRFLKVTQEGHFFDKHDKVLVALSGGLDSMNLFQLLYDNRQLLNIQLGIAHVNHQQREESAKEEVYLRKMAEEKDIPFFCSQFTGKFSENNAREFRYHFFKQIMQQENYTALVTAHHLDDQAETVLMRMLRGSRLRHLSAMQAVQPFANGELIRPLLSFKKSDLEDVFHFEDSSNAGQDYLRNRIRNQYLPQFKSENPQVETALIHLARDAGLLVQALHDLTEKIEVTNMTVFSQQTEPVQRYLLEDYLEKFPDLQLSRPQFEQVLHILLTKANYLHPLKNGYVLEKDYQRFQIYKIQPETDGQLDRIVIKSDGIFTYGPYQLSLNVPLDNADQIIYFPSDDPIILRSRQAGDSLLINGIHKKVRRWFIDQKIPQGQRQNALIIEQSGKIYGIANLTTTDLSILAKNGTIKATLYIKMKE